MENREKVPARYRKHPQTAALLDSLALSARQLAALVEDVKAQFFIDTATWSLPLWEEQAGITPPADATQASRRNAIRDRLLAGGNTNAEMICRIATAMTGYETYITLNGDYSFTLGFLGEADDIVEIDMSRLMASVELIKPAHLRFLIAAISWRRLEAVETTWRGLENSNMTWKRLEAAIPVIRKS